MITLGTSPNTNHEFMIAPMAEFIKALLTAFKRAWLRTTPKGRVYLIIFLVLSVSIGGTIIYAIVSGVYTEFYATPTEELRWARSLCPPAPNGVVACLESEMDAALHHLEKIHPSAHDYSDERVDSGFSGEGSRHRSRGPRTGVGGRAREAASRA